VTANNPINAYAGNNAIVVTDYAGNVKRVAEIIQSVDTPSSGEIEVVRLQHAIASDLAVLVARLVDSGAAPGLDAGQRMSIQADPSTNSLLIRASSPARVELIKRLIGKLDQPLAEATGNVHVVPLRNAEAAALAKTLAGVVPTTETSGGALTMGQRVAASAAPQQGAQAAPAGPMPVAMAGINGQATVQADTATNSLIVTAPEQVYRQLRAVIDKLDVRRAQVLVECLIVEVSTTQAAEFGIQWQTGLSNISSTSTNVVGGTNFGGPTQNITSAAQNLAALGRGLNVGVIKGTVTLPGVGEITNLTALARALETTSKANILSMPAVMTLDNEEAQILVGQNVPIVTGQYVTPGTGGVAVVNPFQTIQRLDIGVSLKVRPQISEGGTIKLGIYQEVSSIDSSTVNPADVVLNKRATETSVLVDSGSIVVLGGLISNSLTSVREKVPVLGNIPGLGALFRYDTRQQVKTNLMLFIRPVMVRGEPVSKALAVDRYDYLRRLQEENAPEKSIVLPEMTVPALPKLEDKGAAPASPPSDTKPSPSR
jgi:general secretion pathway protein D